MPLELSRDHLNPAQFQKPLTNAQAVGDALLFTPGGVSDAVEAVHIGAKWVNFAGGPNATGFTGTVNNVMDVVALPVIARDIVLDIRDGKPLNLARDVTGLTYKSISVVRTNASLSPGTDCTLASVQTPAGIASSTLSGVLAVKKMTTKTQMEGKDFKVIDGDQAPARAVPAAAAPVEGEAADPAAAVAAAVPGKVEVGKDHAVGKTYLAFADGVKNQTRKEGTWKLVKAICKLALGVFGALALFFSIVVPSVVGLGIATVAIVASIFAGVHAAKKDRHDANKQQVIKALTA